MALARSRVSVPALDCVMLAAQSLRRHLVAVALFGRRRAVVLPSALGAA